MAHQIYQTEGIILKKLNFGEADQLCYIYTEQFGMILASAKGIRLEKSKLRNHLNLFSFGRFGVISSREMWRIVDAEKIMPSLENQDDLKMFAEVAALAMRMVQGEERSEEIWRVILGFFCRVAGSESAEEKKVAQAMATAAMMHVLGYVENVPTSASEAVSAVNKAISESML